MYEQFWLKIYVVSWNGKMVLSKKKKITASAAPNMKILLSAFTINITLVTTDEAWNTTPNFVYYNINGRYQPLHKLETKYFFHTYLRGKNPSVRL